MKVFKFKIYHLDKNNRIIDFDENQERYVVANTEEEAEKKLDKYRIEMMKQGSCDFALIGCATVELENVII